MKNLKLSIIALLFVMLVLLTPSFAQTADTDGDGVNDSEDLCVTVKGTKANKGCPEKTKQPEQTPNVSVSEADLLKLQIAYVEEISARDSKYKKLLEQYSTKASAKLQRENLESRKSEMTTIKQIATKALAELGNKISASNKKFFTDRLEDAEYRLKLVNTQLELVALDEKDTGLLGDDFLDKVLTDKPQVKTETKTSSAIKTAKATMEKNDYVSAMKDLDSIINREPNNSEAYAMRGECYRNTKDYDRAIIDFSKAIQINPKYQSAYNLRGLSYGNKNLTLKMRYKTLAEKAEWGKVISDFQKSAELSNQNFEAYEILDKFLDDLAYIQINDERPAPGVVFDTEPITNVWRARNIKYFESLIAVNPKNACALLFLSNNLVMKGTKTPYYEKAVNNFDGKNGARCSAEAAFKLGRDLEFAAREISTSFDDAKKLESINTRVEAVKYFKLALQIDPNWTYPTDWVNSTTAKLEEMGALRNSINNSPRISDSGSGSSIEWSNTSKPKAALDPYKVQKANEEYDRMHTGLEADMKEYIQAFEKLRKADPNLRSLYKGTHYKLHQSRRNANESVEKFIKEYGKYVSQDKINHLYEDLSKFTQIAEKGF